MIRKSLNLNLKLNFFLSTSKDFIFKEKALEMAKKKELTDDDIIMSLNFFIGNYWALT